MDLCASFLLHLVIPKKGKEREDLLYSQCCPRAFDLQPEGCGLYCLTLIGNFLMPAVLAMSVIQASTCP